MANTVDSDETAHYLYLHCLHIQLLLIEFGALRVKVCIKYLVFFRPQHTSLSKIDISEDNEPGLSKLDVVLSFTLEVRTRLQILDSAQKFYSVVYYMCMLAIIAKTKNL